MGLSVQMLLFLSAARHDMCAREQLKAIRLHMQAFGQVDQYWTRACMQTSSMRGPRTSTLSAVSRDLRRDPELISGIGAVDHAEEFNRINVAFVHAELSFCVSSRFFFFCSSLRRWRRGRGESRQERERTAAARVLQVQV